MEFEFIAEMEEAEHILGVKYNLPGQSDINKQLIVSLHIFNADRQCTSSAALEVVDAFKALKEEKEELKNHNQEVFDSLSPLMNTDEEDYAPQKEVIMEYYAEIARGRKDFRKLYKKARKYKVKVGTELQELNTKMETFNDKLKSIGVEPFHSIELPSLELKRVTKATESAYDKIDIANQVVRRLHEKLEVLEDILKSRR